MKYNIKNIEVEVNENLITIKRDEELLKAEAYSNWNEAEDEFKKVCKQVKAYVNK